VISISPAPPEVFVIIEQNVAGSDMKQLQAVRPGHQASSTGGVTLEVPTLTFCLVPVE